MRQWRLNLGDGYNYSEPMDRHVSVEAFKAITETNDDKEITLVPVRYIVIDWADNVMFGGKKFKSFDDGWSYVYDHMEEEELDDVYVVLLSDAIKKDIKLNNIGAK